MASLAERITKNNTFQTYVTFKALVDKPLIEDAFRAYAYLRWLDDGVDVRHATKAGRTAFIRRQKRIIEDSYANGEVKGLAPEEELIAELIATNRDKTSKLGSFILNFFAIIEFDAYRKGSLITKKELEWYSKTLSTGVTDGIEYFINHDFSYPRSPDKYMAAVGWHLTHMLRDYHEDLEEGFLNVPKEYLKKHTINPTDTDSEAFKSWVKSQVSSARQYSKKGMKYWADLPVLRAKLAAFWYSARFDGVLDMIGRDGYVLRPTYPRKKSISSYLRIVAVSLRVSAAHMFR